MNEIEKRLRALESAIRGTYFLLTKGTQQEPIPGALTLAQYKIPIKGTGHLESHERPEDYTEGAVVRAKAMELLGEMGDESAVSVLERGLEDRGDDFGCNLGRITLYFQNETLVKDAAEKALARFRERGVID